MDREDKSESKDHPDRSKNTEMNARKGTEYIVSVANPAKTISSLANPLMHLAVLKDAMEHTTPHCKH